MYLTKLAFNQDHRAISELEQEYLTHRQDLIRIVPEAKSPLRRLLDRPRHFRIHSLWRKKPACELPVYDQEWITYTSDKRIDQFVTALILGTGLIMLIAPMWILQKLQDPTWKLATITLFVVVFLGMVSYARLRSPLTRWLHRLRKYNF